MIAVGLALRLVSFGLPVFVVKYGGSVLWAAMVYLLLAALQPRREPWVLGLEAAIIAALVESSRLYHSPGLDAFRLSLAGKLLLGASFLRGIFWTTGWRLHVWRSSTGRRCGAAPALHEKREGWAPGPHAIPEMPEHRSA